MEAEAWIHLFNLLHFIQTVVLALLIPSPTLVATKFNVQPIDLRRMCQSLYFYILPID